MSVAVRVIPCLDVDAGRVVKGVNFVDLRDAGDPVELAALLRRRGRRRAGRSSTSRPRSGDRETTYDVVRRTAEQVFIPLTVGGGVRIVADVDALLRAGADKVGVNTAAIARPELLAEIAERFGAQCWCSPSTPAACAGAGDADRLRGDDARRAHGTGIDAVDWARRAAELGAGEILLNSMDADGTKDGYDLELIRLVRAAVDRAGDRQRRRGQLADFAPAVDAGADAVLAASVFHFGELRSARSRRRCAPPATRSADPEPCSLVDEKVARLRRGNGAPQPPARVHVSQRSW